MKKHFQCNYRDGQDFGKLASRKLFRADFSRSPDNFKVVMINRGF